MGIQSSQSQKDDLTGLLGRWATGTPADRERLLTAVQWELRRIAAAYMRRERPEHTLQPTALVNEAYMRPDQRPRRTVGQPRPFFRDRRASDATDPR